MSRSLVELTIAVVDIARAAHWSLFVTHDAFNRLDLPALSREKSFANGDCVYASRLQPIPSLPPRCGTSVSVRREAVVNLLVGACYDPSVSGGSSF